MNTKFTRLYTAISSVDTSTVALPYPYFISGFCDGESTFTISITKDNRERKTSRRLVQNREIYSVHPSFAISLNGPNCNIARAKPLEKIQRKGLHTLASPVVPVKIYQNSELERKQIMQDNKGKSGVYV
jgi:hypothetical protein